MSSESILPSSTQGASQTTSKPDDDMPSSPVSATAEGSLIDKSLLEWQNEESAKTLRYRWSNAAERLLTFSGYVCCPECLYFLPARYGKHGAAFTYTLILAYVFVGLPVMYLEMALGQYTSTSPHRIFSRMVPAFSGIAISMIVIVVLRVMFVAAILAHMLHLLITATFSTEVPWANCKNLSAACFEVESNITDRGPLFNQSFPFTTYLFERAITPLYRMKDYNLAEYHLSCNLIAIWVLTMMIILLGPRFIGKMSFVTATVPFAIVIFFFIQGSMIKEAVSGALFVLNPAIRLDAFKDPALFADAILFVLLSLRLGDGSIMHIASHNKFNNNFALDAVFVVVANMLFSLLSVFAAFFYLSHIANCSYRHLGPHDRFKKAILDGLLQDMPIAEIVGHKEETLGHSDSAYIHAALFFLAVFISGIHTMVITMHVIVESIEEKWSPFRKLIRKIFLYVVFIFSAFLCGYFMIVNHGYLVVIYIRKYVAQALPLVVLFEIVAVTWAYRLKRFLANLKTMVGGSIVVKAYWWINWCFTSPMILVIAVLAQIAGARRTMSTRYYPHWSIDIFGRLLTLLIVSCIPAVFLYRMFVAWRSNTPVRSLLRSNAKWGPAATEDRLNAKKSEKAIRAS